MQVSVHCIEHARMMDIVMEIVCFFFFKLATILLFNMKTIDIWIKLYAYYSNDNK